jgi:hypothetical protein
VLTLMSQSPCRGAISGLCLVDHGKDLKREGTQSYSTRKCLFTERHTHGTIFWLNRITSSMDAEALVGALDIVEREDVARFLPNEVIAAEIFRRGWLVLSPADDSVVLPALSVERQPANVARRAGGTLLRQLNIRDNPTEFTEGDRRDLSRQSIQELNLSTRSNKCLSIAGIHTVSTLLTWSEAELQTIPNFGEKSLKEVREVLAEAGLRLS